MNEQNKKDVEILNLAAGVCKRHNRQDLKENLLDLYKEVTKPPHPKDGQIVEFADDDGEHRLLYAGEDGLYEYKEWISSNEFYPQVTWNVASDWHIIEPKKPNMIELPPVEDWPIAASGISIMYNVPSPISNSNACWHDIVKTIIREEMEEMQS
jgi:hypothetical protein